jgi:hypothetical protein
MESAKVILNLILFYEDSICYFLWSCPGLYFDPPWGPRGPEEPG